MLYASRIAGGIGLLFVSSAITMVIPFAIGKVIDIISANQESMVQNLTNVSLILVGIFIFGAACNFGRTYLMGIAGILTQHKLFLYSKLKAYFFKKR
jgi:ATP-binding cassette subfamily B (MDR/TAP) protein 10